MDDPYRHCQKLAHPHLANFLLSCLLLVGIIVSYIPQQIRIITRRSTEGLSPWFVLLGTVAGTCAIANILTLPKSRRDIECCRVLEPFACTADLLGVFQIGTQWASFFFIMFLFLIFTPRSAANGVAISTDSKPLVPTWKDAVIVTSISLFHFIVTFIVSIVIEARSPQWLQLWANILGICSMVLACVQYLPQIWTTWKLKHVGSLSIPMMCIQTPGGFIFALSLGIRLGWQGWSTWAVYIVLGSLQGCLLAMSLWFEYAARLRAADAHQTATDGARLSHEDGDAHDHQNAERSHDDSSETTPLISHRAD